MNNNPPIKSSVWQFPALIALAVAFLLVCFIRRADSPQSALSSDTHGYYIYLPTIFIQGDVHAMSRDHFQGQCFNNRGEAFTKYTCGNAYFYFPFFMAAHLYAKASGQPATGYSTPYCYAIMICGVFWAFVGLFLLLRLLRRYFSIPVSWLALLAVMLGTNYFNYASYENGMSHVYSFTLFAAALYWLDGYYVMPTRKKAVILGALLAGIVLVRPPNMVFLLFTVLYRVTTITDLKQRLNLIKANHTHILWASLAAFIVVLPQLLYWHTMTGHWLKYSYEGEHFIYWNKPKILEVLFDTQNGLFIYSPAMVFAFGGIFAGWRDKRISAWALIIVFCIITYMFASWWAWWFGGAFGHRCYVEYYTVFSFPLAIAIERILAAKSKWIKYGLLFLLLVFCYYTVYYSELYMKVGIFDGPEWQWNFDKWWVYVRQMLGLPPTHHQH